MIWILLVPVALLLVMAAFAAFAAHLPGHDDVGPFDLKLLATYGWVVGLSMMGGIASFHAKVKAGAARWVNLGEFVGELVTSALVGLITYWLCRYAGLNDWLAAAFVAISGHMGTRGLFMLEGILDKWFARLGASVPTERKG